MNDLLRVYLDPAEIGDSGYPWQWTHGTIDGFPPSDERLRIPDLVREQAGHRCVRCQHPFVVGETPGRWSPCDENCTHGGPIRVSYKDGGPDWDPVLITHPQSWLRDGMKNVEAVEAEWRVLTVHHLNGIKHDCRWWNLVSLCQRCHLTIQGKVYMDRPYNRPHSDWFKPYAAGFYAWKYLDLELERHDVMDRLQELLDLELNQERLFDV